MSVTSGQANGYRPFGDIPTGRGSGVANPLRVGGQWYTPADLGEILGCSPDAARKRWKRAVKGGEVTFDRLRGKA